MKKKKVEKKFEKLLKKYPNNDGQDIAWCHLTLGEKAVLLKRDLRVKRIISRFF